jgi:kynurenine/2-aminoadipate aminotransferase
VCIRLITSSFSSSAPLFSLCFTSATYPGALAAIVPLGCTILGVETDGNGLIPESLRNVIEEHHRSGDGSKIKALYTIPTGQNPRGCTTTVERKEEVFRICHDANILILEDDPYYFLRYDFFDGREKGDHWAPPRSYLSMDEDGRVLRFDSFSKIMSSGIRLGWATGPKAFIERVNLHMQAGSLHACSLSQVIVGEMLHLWGIEKFESHIQKAQKLYYNRMLKYKEFMETHLDGLVEWDEPVAGMFAWMRLKGVKDTKKLVMEDCRERGILMVPGNAFYADGDATSPFVRASFSVAPLDKLEEAVRRLGALLRERSK